MTKAISSGVLTLLQAAQANPDAGLYMADLYTITLQSGSVAGIANGQVLTYAALDCPVLWNSYTYLANSLLIDGLKYKATCGPDADAQQITISARVTDTIGGVPFLQAMAQRLLDGAEIQRERAFFSSFAGTPPLVPIGTVILFKGRVTKVDSIGRNQAKVTVESDLTILKDSMPKNAFTPSCTWVLYSSGCTLAASSYTTSGTVGAGSTTALVNWSGVSPNYQQGTLTFTSGVNEGVTTTIKAVTGSALVPMYPLPSTPAAGDTFTATYGCDHTLGSTFLGYISGTTLHVTTAGLGAIPLSSLFGSGVTAGTTILSQATGTTGGAGTYTVSASQTVGSSGSPVEMAAGQGCAKFLNQANFRGFPFVPPPQVITGPLATTANAGKG